MFSFCPAYLPSLFAQAYKGGVFTILMPGYTSELERIEQLLKEQPKGLTITEISDALTLNRNSSAKYLDVLLTSGRVEQRSIGPAKVFFLSQRVPLAAM